MGNKKIDIIKAGSKKFSNYILIILLVMLLFSLIKNISKIKKINLIISDKEAKVDKLRRENEELGKKIEEMKSAEYIEKQIRNNLGLAKEGEIVIVLPDDETLRRLAPKDLEEEEILPDPNWKKWLKLFL
jgi:cell division protein FtsB